uniref:HAMP domain-containing protein n=1 Tax=candidate division WOR-3 bacterium TaxID=2052148 RepID=A0A7C4CB84_UNCW3
MSLTRLRRPRNGSARIQTRIALGMIASALLVVPLVLVAMFYTGRMAQTASQMAESDVELLRIGHAVTFHFLEARRAERNYLIYDDTAYLTAVRASLQSCLIAARRSRTLDTLLSARADSLVAQLDAYRGLLDSLRRIPALRPDPARLRELEALRARHRLALRQAADDSSGRDSLLALAAGLAQQLETAEIVGYAGLALSERIRSTGDAITSLASRITARANQRLAEHEARVRRLSAWSQRNIITVLIIMVGLVVWLVIRLPRTIVLPVKRIANALARAETGDLDVRITPRDKDELGQLAVQLNRVFARLREIDERKTGYIQQLERRFRALANDIGEGVLVFNREASLTYANAASVPLLGMSVAEALGRKVAELPGLAPLREQLENVLAGAASRQECDIFPGLSADAVCLETLRDETGTVTGALAVILNPRSPETAQTESAEATA